MSEQPCYYYKIGFLLRAFSCNPLDIIGEKFSEYQTFVDGWDDCSLQSQFLSIGGIKLSIISKSSLWWLKSPLFISKAVETMEDDVLISFGDILIADNYPISFLIDTAFELKNRNLSGKGLPKIILAAHQLGGM